MLITYLVKTNVSIWSTINILTNVTENVLGTLAAASENHHTYAHRRRDKTFSVPVHPFTHGGR